MWHHKSIIIMTDHHRSPHNITQKYHYHDSQQYHNQLSYDHMTMITWSHSHMTHTTSSHTTHPLHDHDHTLHDHDHTLHDHDHTLHSYYIILTWPLFLPSLSLPPPFLLRTNDSVPFNPRPKCTHTRRLRHPKPRKRPLWPKVLYDIAHKGKCRCPIAVI